jgi:lysophospholipase L1-like esterase
MRFSNVKAVRIPKSVTEIRHEGNRIWSPIRARYVSLGDSIAAGHSIDGDWSKKYGEGSQFGVNGNKETAIVLNSYTDLIHRDLMQKYGGTVNATSFARSGDRVDDLIAKLDHVRVQNAIKKADYVTVCIGANDILEPAFSNLEEYINTGSLANAEAVIEQNFAALADDNNANSYTALFNKLSALNPNAKYVFTTVYNPYKYLHIEDGRDGFFAPMLSLIPEMNIDVDEVIENMFTGGNNLVYFDFSKGEWMSIDLEIDVDSIIKEGILSTPIFRQLFDRVNGVSSWAENYVNRLNELLRNKINAYKAVNPNFSIAETKAAFDTYSDRTGAGNVHYNDLVNVEYTRGYNTATMNWPALWYEDYNDNCAAFWTDLVWSHLHWSNGYPSWNVADYVTFDLNGFAVDLAERVIQKVIIPDVDPHPEEYGHVVLKGAFGIS